MTINMGWPEWILTAIALLDMGARCVQRGREYKAASDRLAAVIGASIGFAGLIGLLYWGGFYA